MHFIHWLNHTPSDIQASELIIRGEDWWTGQLVRGRLGRWRESCYSVSDAAAGHWAVTWPLSFPAGRQVCWSTWQSFFLSMMSIVFVLWNLRSFLLNTAGSIIVVRQEKQSWNFNRKKLTQLTKNQWCRVLLTLLCHWVTILVLSANSL